jgi:hypothetical protein
MKEKTYKKGMTEVWSDGEKVVVKNSAGKEWVETNIDDLFGVGEYVKLQEVCYTEEVTPKSGEKKNSYEMVSGYVPRVIAEDFKSPLSGLGDV